MNYDPLGRLITELRADSGVQAVVPVDQAGRRRVRGFEPQGGEDPDARGPGEYVNHVVLVNLGGVRSRRLPTQRVRIAAKCAGTTPEQAAAVGTAVSNALHFLGKRVASGLGIYFSFDDTGGEQDKDPDTDQPIVTHFFDLLATTQAVA